MKSNELVPEYRTDKNGRRVIRHVLPQQGTRVSASLANAAPVAPAPAERVEFSSEMKSFWDRNDIADTHYGADDFDPRAVTFLNHLFSADSEHESHKIMRALEQSFTEMMGFGEEDEGVRSVHNIAAFADDIHTVTNVRASIDGLHANLGYQKDYLIDSNDEERAVAASIMLFAEAIGERASNWSEYLELTSGKYNHALTFTDYDMLELAREMAGRTDELLELIEDDAPLPSADTLRDRLAHSERALASGVL